MNDLRIESRFKNAALYNAMIAFCTDEAVRIGNPRYPLPYFAVLSRMTGVSQGLLRNIMNLQETPWNKHGNLKECGERIVNALSADPEEIFPRHLYAMATPRVMVKEVDSIQMLAIAAAKQIEAPSMDAAMENRRFREAMDEVINSLSPREQTIIRNRFGFDCEEMTLQQIGDSFGVTRSRIMDIEHKALRKLRHPFRSNKLREFTRTG